MNLQLRGKSVLVTGASKGIGLACALWWLARYRPGLVDGWPVWPWYAWAWIGVLSSVLSDDSAGRRAHLCRRPCRGRSDDGPDQL